MALILIVKKASKQFARELAYRRGESYHRPYNLPSSRHEGIAATVEDSKSSHRGARL